MVGFTEERSKVSSSLLACRPRTYFHCRSLAITLLMYQWPLPLHVHRLQSSKAICSHCLCLASRLWGLWILGRPEPPPGCLLEFLSSEWVRPLCAWRKSDMVCKVLVDLEVLDAWLGTVPSQAKWILSDIVLLMFVHVDGFVGNELLCLTLILHLPDFANLGAINS